MFEFVLPDLGEGIQEAEILAWHASVGEEIARDAPLVDVETDKAAVTIPSPVAGRVVRLGGAVGDVLRVGHVVAVIDPGGEAPRLEAPPAESRAPQAAEPPREAARATSASPVGGPARGRVAAAPATRRLARELGVDLGQVDPSGPGGRVTSGDVRRAASGTEGRSGSPDLGAPARAEAPPAEREPRLGTGTGIPLLEVEPLPDFSVFGPVETEPLRSIRRKVARRMTQASVLVAQVSHVDEADVTALETLRRRERERRSGQPGGRLTLLAFVIKAVVAGLKQYRMFNASLDPLREEIFYKRYFNIGVAVDSPKGLVVPVLEAADRRSVIEIAVALEELATKAREDRLQAADFRGGTFTVSNIGNLGGFSPNPIVNYPEAAILGVGRAEEKPVVQGGEIVVRTRMPLALSFDHRIADGGEAARFMSDLKRRLGDPATLLVEA